MELKAVGKTIIITTHTADCPLCGVVRAVDKYGSKFISDGDAVYCSRCGMYIEKEDVCGIKHGA